MKPALLPLTYAGEYYDRTMPLFTGEIAPAGVDLRCIHLDIPDLYWRQAKYPEFDSSEYSLGAHLASVENPDWPYTALPVFLSKTFRQSTIYVRADAGITSPRDLEGRTIGTTEWSATATLWARGILSDYCQVDIRKIRWRTGGLQVPGRSEKTRLLDVGFDRAPLPDDMSLVQAFVAGRIDGIVSSLEPKLPHLDGGRLVRLFPDTRAADIAYYRATGIIPLLHTVILRKDLVAAHPWLANNLKAAFDRAQKQANARLFYGGAAGSSLIWEAAHAAEERQLFGDPFAYGIENNRKALDAICRYAHEQGLTGRLLTLEDLFPVSTLSTTYLYR